LAGRAAEAADAGRAGPAQLAALAAGFSALGWTGTELYRSVSRALLLRRRRRRRQQRPGRPPDEDEDGAASPASASASSAAASPCASLDLAGVAAASAGMLRAGWAPADLFSALGRRAEAVLARGQRQQRQQQQQQQRGRRARPPAASPLATTVRPEHLALAAWALAAAGHGRARLARLVAARTFELCRRGEGGGGFARRRDVARLAAAFGVGDDDDDDGPAEFPPLPSPLPLPAQELAAVRAALRRERARLEQRAQWRERRVGEAAEAEAGRRRIVGGGGGTAAR